MGLTSKTEHSLYQVLDKDNQDFISQLSGDYRLTHQEIRELCEVARDLEQWQLEPLPSWWAARERDLESGDIPLRKKALFTAMRQFVRETQAAPSSYEQATGPMRQAALKLESVKSTKQISGICPVYSEDTVCCNLHTIDAVENCGFGCNYCTIQSFYGERVSFDADLAEKLDLIDIDPSRFYHFGTGQSSDSLMWGNRNGILDDLCAFARKHPNILLEFKTKSDNVSYFLENEVPKNIVLTWSLNTDTIIENEEKLTASLNRRLDAAKKVSEQGIRLGFHFHPMVYYQGWEVDYPQLALRVQSLFSSNQVLFMSMGSVTFIKPVMKAIRQRGRATKMLQMTMDRDPKGKFTYPDDIKIQMFKKMHAALEPWREKVFMYLCMEKAAIWEHVFGTVYSNNETFEAELYRAASLKL